MQVQSLAWEDPLEKEMVTHSSILAWRIPWTEEPGGLQFIGSQRVGLKRLKMHTISWKSNLKFIECLLHARHCYKHCAHE